jgi:hypothetical protein
MYRSTLLTLLTLLAIVSFAFSACGAGNSPEGVVRAYVDAVNARDRDKFVSLWPPDMRDGASSSYDAVVRSNVRFLEVKDVVVRDIGGAPTWKDVTLLTTVVDAQYGRRDAKYWFKVEKIEGRWYIVD